MRKKKQTSEKIDRRVSSLRREFNTVKQESHNNDNDWIEKRLDDEDTDDIAFK
jgi:hypothetical protein